MKYIVILLVLLLTFLSIFIPSKQKKYYYIFLAFIMSLIALDIYPSRTLDLNRMYNEMESLKGLSLPLLLKNDLFLKVPTYTIYIYLIGLTGFKRLFQSSTIFIEYLLMLLLIRDASEKNKLSNKTELFLLMVYFAINDFIYSVANVRFYFSTTIFVYTLYKDLICKSNLKKCFLIYIFCCLYHNSLAIMLFLRLLLFIYNKNKVLKFTINFLLFSWTNLKMAIINLLSKFESIPFFKITAYKLGAYDDYEANLTANVKLYTFVSLTLLLITLTIFIFYKCSLKKEYTESNKKHDDYLTMFYFFIFGSIGEFHIFTRYTEVIFKLTIIKIANLFSYKSKLFYKNKLICFLILSIEATLFQIFYIIGKYNLVYFGW